MELHERRQAEEELRIRARQQAVVAELGQRALAGIDLAALMDAAVELVAETLHVEYSKVLELLPDGEALLLRAGVGWQEGWVGRATVSANLESQAGYTLLSSEPVIVEDLSTETRFSGPPLLNDHRVVSGISVIIQGEGRPFGVMGAHTTSRRTFTQDDIHFLQAVANVLAQAIQRKQAEAEIRKLSQFQESIIDNANVWLDVLDEKANVVIWNKAAEEISGYSRQEVVGHGKIWEWLYPDEDYRHEVVAQAIAIIKEGGEERDSETTIRCKDGQTRIISWNSRNLVGEKGNPIGSIALGRDVTERVRAEAALKEYSEHLEEMVEARTKELRDAQEQLVRREKLATLGQLAGGIAHELRNPLGAISNAAYFLNMVGQTAFGTEEPEPAVKEMLGILQREVRASEKIIGGLLDYARTRPPIRQTVNVNAVVQEVLTRAGVPANVQVTTDLDEMLPAIQADPDQLAQVFDNLIRNAVQAIPEGGNLVIRTEVSSDRPNEFGTLSASNLQSPISISFTDTGVGIPEENLEKLFEPLFTTKAKGTGLGLALVKMLVEGHGGIIEVESTLGEGSTFTVRLPAA